VAPKTLTGTSTPANDTPPFQIERGMWRFYPVREPVHAVRIAFLRGVSG
jgi:hypothetical protein